MKIGCRVPACPGQAHAKGFCPSHYAKMRRWGKIECPSDGRGKSPGSQKALVYRIPKGTVPWNKGKPFMRGENHPNWKGGISDMRKVIMQSLEYRLWRKAVFERDNYTCVWCGDDSGGNLEADHIKPFALFPELRFAIDNGRTLCHKCHLTTETYGGVR